MSLDIFPWHEFQASVYSQQNPDGTRGGKRDLSTVLQGSAEIPIPRTCRQKLQQVTVRKMSQCSRCPKESPESPRGSATSSQIRAHQLLGQLRLSQASLLGICSWPDVRSLEVRNISPVPGAVQASGGLASSEGSPTEDPATRFSSCRQQALDSKSLLGYPN